MKPLDSDIGDLLYVSAVLGRDRSIHNCVILGGQISLLYASIYGVSCALRVQESVKFISEWFS